MASPPVVTSPSNYSTQTVPFDISGTSDGVLVEVRDAAGLLLPATTNPVVVSGGNFTIHVTSLVGDRGGAYITGQGTVNPSPPTLNTVPASTTVGTAVAVGGTVNTTSTQTIRIYKDGEGTATATQSNIAAGSFSIDVTGLTEGSHYLEVIAEENSLATPRFRVPVVGDPGAPGAQDDVFSITGSSITLRGVAAAVSGNRSASSAPGINLAPEYPSGGSAPQAGDLVLLFLFSRSNTVSWMPSVACTLQGAHDTTATTVTVRETLAADTPSSGTLRVGASSASGVTVTYTSVNIGTRTFTLSGTLGMSLADNANCNVPQGGWTSLNKQVGSATQGTQELMMRTAAGGESGARLVTAYGTGGTSDTQLGYIVVFDNAAVVSPLDATPVFQNFAGTASLDHPGITTANNGDAIIIFNGKYQGVALGSADYSSWSGLGGALSDATELFDVSTNDGGNAAIGAAWGIQTSAGATGNITATVANFAATGSTMVYAIKKA